MRRVTCKIGKDSDGKGKAKQYCPEQTKRFLILIISIYAQQSEYFGTIQWIHTHVFFSSSDLMGSGACFVLMLRVLVLLFHVRHIIRFN